MKQLALDPCENIVAVVPKVVRRDVKLLYVYIEHGVTGVIRDEALLEEDMSTELLKLFGVGQEAHKALLAALEKEGVKYEWQ
jgi:hypothetical protein